MQYHHFITKAIFGAAFCTALVATAWADTYDISAGPITVKVDETGQYVTWGEKTVSDSDPVIIGLSQSVGSVHANTLLVEAAQGTRGNLTFQNLTIDASIEENLSPVKLTGKGGILLKLDGQNQLSGGKLNAGLETGNVSLWISEKTENSGLSSRGGEMGAGIGGGLGMSAGNITVLGGKIQALGGSYAAGIGGGQGGSGRSITVSGGQVIAKTGSGELAYGAGIGGGQNGCGENIMITGGAVSAAGSDFGAAIGGGQGGDGSQISVTGGNITASAGEYAPGIGGGWGGKTEEIRILGGRTEAIGSPALGDGSLNSDIQVSAKAGAIRISSDGKSLETVDKGSAITYVYANQRILLESSLPVPEKIQEPAETAVPEETQENFAEEAGEPEPPEKTQPEASDASEETEPSEAVQLQPEAEPIPEETTSEEAASEVETTSEAPRETEPAETDAVVESPKDLTVTDLEGNPVAYTKKALSGILYIKTQVQDGIYTVSLEDLQALEKMKIRNISLTFHEVESEISVESLLAAVGDVQSAALRAEGGSVVLMVDGQPKQLS